VLAGADRIEGTLLGNGERTGNMDIITMGMNLYSRGIDPNLVFDDIKEIIEVVEYCTELPVAARHPWAGELVYTAFSGSHQDAIRKSMNYHTEHGLSQWDVAYLPIDPRDIGREYEAVVRINSQSGKGGVALVLERDFNIELPKWMHGALSRQVQGAAEASGVEVSPSVIKALYDEHFMDVAASWKLDSYDLHTEGHKVSAQFNIAGSVFKGEGTGALEALCHALTERFQCAIDVQQYDQHAMGSGSDAQAQACIEVRIDADVHYGVAVAEDTSAATLQALLSAFSRSQVASAVAA
jgi:2-isopropylmalate synthase